MKRRIFLRNTAMMTLATGFIPRFGLSLPFSNPTLPALIPLADPVSQIRHGALHFPLFSGKNPTLPFDWLWQVQRNIFFKNGFQRNEATDLEIISVLLNTDITNEDSTLEALQIQLEAQQTSLMFQDQLISIPLETEWYQLDQPEQHLSFYLAHWKKGKKVPLFLDKHTDQYLQVLEGSISCEGMRVPANNSLALTDKEPMYIEVLEDCRLLILARTND